MAIPPLDERGLLPEGVHETDLAQIRKIFAFNKRRCCLLDNFEKLIHEELTKIILGWPITIAGSYLTDKEIPGDIEVAVKIDFSLCGTRISEFTNILQDPMGYNSWCKSTYEIDFYWYLPWQNDFRSFFQYVGPKTGLAKGLHEKDRRGVLEIII